MKIVVCRDRVIAWMMECQYHCIVVVVSKWAWLVCMVDGIILCGNVLIAISSFLHAICYYCMYGNDVLLWYVNPPGGFIDVCCDTLVERVDDAGSIWLIASCDGGGIGIYIIYKIIGIARVAIMCIIAYNITDRCSVHIVAFVPLGNMLYELLPDGNAGATTVCGYLVG